MNLRLIGLAAILAIPAFAGLKITSAPLTPMTPAQVIAFKLQAEDEYHVKVVAEITERRDLLIGAIDNLAATCDRTSPCGNDVIRQKALAAKQIRKAFSDERIRHAIAEKNIQAGVGTY